MYKPNARFSKNLIMFYFPVDSKVEKENKQMLTFLPAHT